MKTRYIASLLLIVALLIVTDTAQAHANLVISVPAANAVLHLAPEEIRLWFSERLEPQFSSITLLNSQGDRVETTASLVDSVDPTQLSVKPPRTLPNDVYTVSWQVISADDGHPSKGSFSFTIGDTDRAGQAVNLTDSSISVTSAGIRTFNLWTLALLVGGIGFWLFTWSPAVPQSNPALERRMNILIAVGWVLVGFGSVLMLLLQTSTTANVSLIEAIGSPILGSIIVGTRYGLLWMVRVALWILIGIVLWWPTASKWRLWVALIIGVGLLLTNSLFSHASAAPDETAAVFSDWLHLLSTALWVGGLVQFVNVIGVLRKQSPSATSTAARMVGYFSNYARICVVGLIITGSYAAWLQVGSISALLTTLYGQSLLMKLIFFLPLLGLAAINLFVTQRKLNAGESLWVGRLRELVGVEIILTLGVLIAVGAMTSSSPARTAYAAQQPNSFAAQPTPYSDMSMLDDVHVGFDVVPGWVGVNTFTVTLATFEGAWIPDATLVRLRFESEDNPSLGRSELKLEHTQDGTYTARGANISLPGKWKVRVNIQRPNAYDTVTDFFPAAVIPPQASDPAPPLSDRVVALSAVGLLGLIAGGYSAMRSSFRPLRADALLSLGLIALGILMLFSVARLTG